MYSPHCGKDSRQRNDKITSFSRSLFVENNARDVAVDRCRSLPGSASQSLTLRCIDQLRTRHLVIHQSYHNVSSEC